MALFTVDLGRVLKIKSSRPIFTCDLEDWHHGLHVNKGNHSSIKSVWWLQYKLNQYKVRAVFYVLGQFSDEWPGKVDSLRSEGHVIKSHGQYHYANEEADRKPYSWLGFTGGFYFRALPYWFIKWQVELNNQFYIHPHDLDEEHPQLRNKFLDWKRHIGLKQSRMKLERLLQEVKWDDPS